MFYGTFQYSETVLSKGTPMGIICKFQVAIWLHQLESNNSNYQIILADIGGIFGCFCGASLISMIEVMVITVCTCWQMFALLSKRKLVVS